MLSHERASHERLPHWEGILWEIGYQIPGSAQPSKLP